MKPPVWISAIPDHAAQEGPLKGLRFAVKDNIDYAGVPTTAGCPAYAYTPSATASVIKALEAAGAVAVGKTNLDQFATGLVGVRSPYGACSSVFDKDYVSGGSSSGSAVAVATKQVDFALGTDTAGSGRVPAAFNNLIGLKPTRGVFSMSGVVPACRSLDTVSVFARDVDTAARLFDAAAVYDPSDWSARPMVDFPAPWVNGKFRLGVLRADQREFFGDVEAAKLYEAAINKMGGEPVEIDYTPFRDAAALLYQGPWVAERLAAIEEFIHLRGDQMHPVVRGIINGASKFTAVDSYRALYRLGELKRAAEAEWQKMDVLFLPTTGTIYKIADVEADPVRLNTNLGYYTNFVNLFDLAALAIPAGFRPNGLPFGVTLIGPAFSDRALLAVAGRATAQAPGCIDVAVVGAHLTGQPLNRQLTERGARLRKSCRSAAGYRLYALANTTPPKPGLVRNEAFAGPGIELEVWQMPLSEFGGFVSLIPAPLGIGSVTLDDGSTVKGFICEPAGLQDALEITSFGGWRAYLQRD
ncbi:MAG: allophanate hydrolase [Bryobacteraceae bacterium]|nr:allophanate hydrolase [Bryobacteraceae bacterium]